MPTLLLIVAACTVVVFVTVKFLNAACVFGTEIAEEHAERVAERVAERERRVAAGETEPAKRVPGWIVFIVLIATVGIVAAVCVVNRNGG